MHASQNQEEEIVRALRQIMRAVELQSHRLADEYGLTGPQLATLNEAARLDEAPLGELAKAVHVSQATMSGILDRLEKRGLVQRVRGTRDRRSVWISLTEAGRNILDAAPPMLNEHFRAELSKLEVWEQTAILATLQRIAAMISLPRGEERLHIGRAPDAARPEADPEAGFAV
jgi:DNA-binding MarR family transcriptional regulator